MELEILKITGQIAGIGGIAIGATIIIFKDVIAKNIFPSLTKTQAYSLLKLIIILTFSIAIIGILSWTYLSTIPIEAHKEEEIAEKLKIKSQLHNCLNGNISDCQKLQSKFNTADIGCKEYVNTLKSTISTSNEGINIFKQERYCENMKSISISMIALLKKMYKKCAKSISSQECKGSLNLLRSSFNSSSRIEFNSFDEASVIDYLTKYN